MTVLFFQARWNGLCAGVLEASRNGTVQIYNDEGRRIASRGKNHYCPTVFVSTFNKVAGESCSHTDMRDGELLALCCVLEYYSPFDLWLIVRSRTFL